MKYVFLAIFFLSTVLHLFARKAHYDILKDQTKGFIVLSLVGYYALSVDNPSWFVIIALIMSWLGDLFLIPHGVKWFVVGGILFMVSHLFFIISYITITDFNEVPIWAAVTIGAFFIIIVGLVFIKLKTYLPKALFIPMFFYLILNGGMNSFAIYRLIASPKIGPIITVIGAILFFASDSLLFYARFKKDTKQKDHFLVMLTYSFAELLIVLGLIL